jgi:hypothetical protein
MIRVYQFGCLAPTENEALVRQQMRAAHDYRNDLVAIERGRRWAVRQVHDTLEVRAAIANLHTAGKADRKDALKLLDKARREAEANAQDETARIKQLDASIRLDARELIRDSARVASKLFWGSYLGVEAAADQSRQLKLYDWDGVTPTDPQFVRGPRLGREAFGPEDARSAWWLGDQQVGMQLQGGLSTRDALAGTDNRVRLILGPARRHGAKGYSQYGHVWLRVGSDGREPIWAKWPVKLHRAIPDNATWKWVRCSLRRDGMRERWSVEITLDIAAESPRTLDVELSGTMALSLMWEAKEDGSIQVGSWCDSRGASGDVHVPARIVNALGKAADIQGIRDTALNVLRNELPEMILSSDSVPLWLLEEAAAMRTWKSQQRFHGLVMRWRKERLDAARPAYEMLQAWELRDLHLYDYETGARGGALRARRDLYRVLASQWASQYRTIILPDRDLSREARWGQESDVRFAAGPSELTAAVGHAFGRDRILADWSEGAVASDDRSWAQRALENWAAGQTAVSARAARKAKKVVVVEGNAWANRKAKKALRAAAIEG